MLDISPPNITTPAALNNTTRKNIDISVMLSFLLQSEACTVLPQLEMFAPTTSRQQTYHSSPEANRTIHFQLANGPAFNAHRFHAQRGRGMTIIVAIRDPQRQRPLPQRFKSWLDIICRRPTLLARMHQRGSPIRGELPYPGHEARYFAVRRFS